MGTPIEPPLPKASFSSEERVEGGGPNCPRAPSSSEEGVGGGGPSRPRAPSSSEEGVGGGGPSRNVLLQRAAAMRKNPTEPERRIWMALRDSRLASFKFRRQAVIGWRIVDFFCPERGLIVEIDGHTHDPDDDARRDEDMARRFGFATFRCTNCDVMDNLDGVLMALLATLEARDLRWTGRRGTTPQPPPLKRRGSPATVAP